MGILRTDKVSGLETPTAAVTGSVYFDGSDDFLTLPDSCGFDSSTSYTVEMWVKDVEVPSGSSPFFTFGASGATNQTFNIDYTSAGNLRLDYYSNNISFSVDLNDGNWHHIAATYDGTTRRLFADGYLGASDTTTNGAYVADNVRVGRMNWISRFAKCYISNLRVVTGTALYTSDFTVPTHALEVIGGTILLCCNNKDNAAAIDHANIGVSKSITVNGGAAVSTLSPSLTRDFTYGTEFQGVATFDTQGYFVPPSGTTEQRGAGRAIFAGGYVAPTRNAFIESVNINSLGNTTKFGTLKGNHVPTSTSSATRQIVAGGYDGSGVVDNIDFITIATSGDAVDFGTLGTARRDMAGLSNNTRSIWGGGTTTGSTTPTDNMEYVTSASLGSGTPFGTLTVSGRSNAACASPTRGMFFGGYQAYASPVSTYTNVINYITIATTGGGTDFGDLAIDNSGKKGGHAAFSSSTRGVVGGGAIYGPDAPAYTPYNTIEYVTIASTGNAQNFGDLTGANNFLSGTSNSTRGIFNQGSSPTYLNTIQYVTIASTGNAQEFGDAINSSYTHNNSSSDSHGGLS